MFEAWKPFAIQGIRSTGNKSIKFIAKTHEIDVSAKGPIMLLFFGTKVSFTAPRTKSNAYSKAFCNLLGFFTEAFLVIDQKKKLTRQPRKIETAMVST